MAKQEYIQKNQKYLEDKANEPGIHTLDKGILYKIIKTGNTQTPTPNRNSVITVHYTGRTINGKTFDTTRSSTPAAFRLRDLIPGWIIPLQQMHPGDRWEIYIPASQAYGKTTQPGIPGGSTLIFDIELLSIN